MPQRQQGQQKKDGQSQAVDGQPLREYRPKNLPSASPQGDGEQKQLRGEE